MTMHKIQSIRDTFEPGGYLKKSYGNYVIIETLINDDIHYIKFNHLDEVLVDIDDLINIGDVIGLSGSTGNAADPDVTPHLHFQVFDNEWNSLNPMEFIFTNFDNNFNPTNDDCNN